VMKEINIEEFQEKIQIEFNDKELLNIALTHSSFSNERKINKRANNERLEFLGDAVLEIVVSDYLFRAYPKKPEGELTKLRASLVCEPTLAACARDISLGNYLFLSKGETLTGGDDRDSILSDAFEAVIGAVYMDQGYDKAKFFIDTYLLGDVEDKVLFYDSKTKLQEMVQSISKERVEYRLIKEEGPDHMKTFTVEVMLEDKLLGVGEGRSKKSAEQKAAYEAIKSKKI
jgi:ribonuclease-3